MSEALLFTRFDEGRKAAKLDTRDIRNETRRKFKEGNEESDEEKSASET